MTPPDLPRPAPPTHRHLPLAWLVTWAAVLAGACTSTHELVPHKQLGTDASAPSMPPEGWLAEPYFQGGNGTPEQYTALHDAIAGHSFWGVTVYDGERTVAYEVDFHGDGSFETRCLKALTCEPFGVGTQGSGDLSWQLINVDASGRGLGEFRTGFATYEYVLPMREVVYDSERAVLRFFLRSALVTQGALGASSVAEVVLTRGHYDGRDLVASEVARGRLSKGAP